MNSKTVEAVARSIYREFENRPRYAQAQMNGVTASECAQAAITAHLKVLEEEGPTEAMLKAAHDRLAGDGDVSDIFRAMISTALNEKDAG